MHNHIRCEAIPLFYVAHEYRICEPDCAASPSPIQGNGGPNDGVYIRTTFNRSLTILSAYENLLVVLEYVASSLNGAPSDPTSCFSGGVFSPEKCSDFVWKMYLKTSPTAVTQPFLLLVPPFFNSIYGVNGINPSTGALSGTTISAKQFIIPLSAYPNATTLQLSRINSNFPNPPTLLRSTCTAAGSTHNYNTPLCSGIVFYSMTMYRI